jgi:hypothetical protein
MTRRSVTLFILSFTLSAVNLGCGPDTESQPGGDTTQIVADAGTTPTPDGASLPDTTPGADGTQPLPDGAPPPDTTPTPDTAKAPDMKSPPDAGKPDAKPCNPSLQGSYSAPLSFKAEEKLGSSVINKMACSGTLTAKVTCGQVPVLQGSYTCNYSGGLVVFDKKQTGTIQGSVEVGGGFTGQIKHSYSSSLKKTYSTTGTISGGKFTGSGKGSLYPNPKSVVAWKVTFSF